MSNNEFIDWINSNSLYCKDVVRKNSNITRAIIARGEKIEQYYS